jgi:hypothetical protein
VKDKLKLIAVLSFLLCSSLACRASFLPEDFRTLPKEKGALFFQDSFSDPSSGWDRVRQAEGLTDYDGGTYRIYVNARDADYWANPGLNFTDVEVEVETKKIGGPDNNNFGVLCRYQNMGNFYFLIISSDGYYGIGKVENGKQRLIEPDQMLPSEVIRKGSQFNHIRAACDGTRLALAVNGELVAETEDATFLEGDVGLIAGSFEEPGVDIIFDNFVVRRP